MFEGHEEFRALCDRIGVDPGRRQALKLRLLRLADDLQAAKATADIAGSRPQQLARFRTLSAQLARTIAALELGNPAYQQVLTNLWAPLIARYLSSSAIDETKPGRRVAEVEQREIGYYACRDFGDPASLDNAEFRYREPEGGIEALLASKRRAALGQIVTPYLTHVLSQLYQELDDALGEEQQSPRAKGGNPGDRWRAYVIKRLLVIYREFTDKEATGSPEGLFEALCRYTLAELGFEKTGLAEAVERAVYPRNLSDKT